MLRSQTEMQTHLLLSGHRTRRKSLISSLAYVLLLSTNLLSQTETDRVIEFDAIEGQEPFVVHVSHSEKFAAIAFSKDTWGQEPVPSSLVFLSLDGEKPTRMVDVSQFNDEIEPLNISALSDDGKHLLVERLERKGKRSKELWTVLDCSGSEPRVLMDIPRTPSASSAAWLSPNELLIGTAQGAFHRVKIENGNAELKERKPNAPTTFLMRSVAISPNRKFMAMPNEQDRIAVYRTTEPYKQAIQIPVELSVKEIMLTNSHLLSFTSGECFAWDLRKNELAGKGEGSRYFTNRPTQQVSGLKGTEGVTLFRTLPKGNYGVLLDFASGDSTPIKIPYPAVGIGRRRRIWFVDTNDQAKLNLRSFVLPTESAGTIEVP